MADIQPLAKLSEAILNQRPADHRCWASWSQISQVWSRPELLSWPAYSWADFWSDLLYSTGNRYKGEKRHRNGPCEFQTESCGAGVSKFSRSSPTPLPKDWISRFWGTWSYPPAQGICQHWRLLNRASWVGMWLDSKVSHPMVGHPWVVAWLKKMGWAYQGLSWQLMRALERGARAERSWVSC